MTLASTPDHLRHRDATRPPAGSETPPKAVLFCECGREAPPHAWRTDRNGDRRRLRCPDCGETLTVR